MGNRGIVSVRWVGLLLVVMLLLGVGAVALGVVGAPSVQSMDNTFTAVNDEETTIATEITINNPNPVGVGTDDVTVNYTIDMNEIEMAHGGRSGIALGTGNTTLDLETHLLNEAIPEWWVSHIKNDEQTELAVHAAVASDRFDRSTDLTYTHDVETNIIGEFNSQEPRPVNANSPLTSDPVLYINETQAAWGTVTEQDTPIEKAFTVYNPNVEPYAITELRYEITMNDIVVGEGESHDTHVIGSRDTQEVGLTTTIDNNQLDVWWVTHLDDEIHGHQVTSLTIEFEAVLELPSGEEVTVPLDELTYEETIETDIFDEGESAQLDGEADADPGDDSDPADSDDATDDNDTDESDDDMSGDGPNGDDTSDDGIEDDDAGDEDADDDDGLLL